ncbi:MAG: photosystem II S4 domain protein [Prochlorococcaceae cyanobacterium]|jgi:photosystem II S4 domain protein
MVLPRRALLEGSRHPEGLAAVIDAAEQALRTWEPVWTGLLPAEVREEAAARLGALAELDLQSWGGFPGAERRRLLLQRSEAAQPLEPAGAGLCGLEISGNFLFDPAGLDDLRAGLEAAGVQESERGDLWLRGDRGGQAVVLQETAERLHGGAGQVRTVPVRFERRPLEELQLPVARQPRPLTVVEASLRLDAVASAGFGVSRNRMANAIRQGEVRLAWQPVQSPSRELAPGDRIRWHGHGEVEVRSVTPTKRGRLRIDLVRS